MDRKRTAGLSAIVALVIGACGSGGTGAPGGASASSAAASPQAVVATGAATVASPAASASPNPLTGDMNGAFTVTHTLKAVENFPKFHMKVGDTETRAWTVSQRCPAPCPMTVTVTQGDQSADFAWTYSDGMYRFTQTGFTQDCVIKGKSTKHGYDVSFVTEMAPVETKLDGTALIATKLEGQQSQIGAVTAAGKKAGCTPYHATFDSEAVR